MARFEIAGHDNRILRERGAGREEEEERGGGKDQSSLAVELARPDDVYPRGDSSRGATVIWSGGEYVWRERGKVTRRRRRRRRIRVEKAVQVEEGESKLRREQKKKRRRGGPPKKKEEYRETRTGSSGTKGGRRKVRELVGGTEIEGGPCGKGRGGADQAVLENMRMVARVVYM